MFHYTFLPPSITIDICRTREDVRNRELSAVMPSDISLFAMYSMSSGSFRRPFLPPPLKHVLSTVSTGVMLSPSSSAFLQCSSLHFMPDMPSFSLHVMPQPSGWRDIEVYRLISLLMPTFSLSAVSSPAQVRHLIFLYLSMIFSDMRQHAMIFQSARCMFSSCLMFFAERPARAAACECSRLARVARRLSRSELACIRRFLPIPSPLVPSVHPPHSFFFLLPSMGERQGRI